MALGISKSYTPSAGQISDPTAYNTDLAALFNAFSGLEAQTSTLGGLTITPSADGTTKFRVTNAAGTELLSADTTNSAFKIKATAKLYFDGGTDTYLQESAADILDIYVGGVNMMKFTEAATDKIEVLGSDLEIDATKKFYFDGGGNTYIHESSADNLEVVVAAAVALTFLGGNDIQLEDNGRLYFGTTSNMFIMYDQPNDDVIFVSGADPILTLKSGGDVEILASKKFYFDGGVDTYMYQSAGDVLDVYVGGVNMMKFTEAATDKVEVLNSHLEIDAAKIFYLDGGGDTYMHEKSANVFELVVGNSAKIYIDHANGNVGLGMDYSDL